MESGEIDQPSNNDDASGPALAYWKKQKANLHGIMGGFPELSEFDLADSRRFIKSRLISKITINPNQSKRPFNRVADLGAGIGRVSDLVLAQFCDQVDLFEPVKKLLDIAKEHLCYNNNNTPTNISRPKFTFHQSTLQDFAHKYERNSDQYISDSYDLIWIQWVG